MRIDSERARKIRALVSELNDRAVEHGIPATVTMSSLVLSWISERLEIEFRLLERRTKK